MSKLPGEDKAIRSYIEIRLDDATLGLSAGPPRRLGAWMCTCLSGSGGPYLKPEDPEILALVERAEKILTAQKMARRLSGED